MKKWPVIIGIVIILTLVCSPAFAISKSDLIVSYTGQSIPTKPTPTQRISETSETISFSNTTSIGYYPKIADYLYNQSEEAVQQYQQGLLHHSLYPVPGWVGNLTDYNERVKSLIIRSFEAS
jgi:hypothetical protein